MVAGKLVKFATLIAGAGSIANLANCGDSTSNQLSDETKAEAEVWFSSNAGTSDLLDLFTQLEKWPVARQSIDVFSFSMGQIVAGGFCGPHGQHLDRLKNTLARIVPAFDVSRACLPI